MNSNNNSITKKNKSKKHIRHNRRKIRVRVSVFTGRERGGNQGSETRERESSELRDSKGRERSRVFAQSERTEREIGLGKNPRS